MRIVQNLKDHDRLGEHPVQAADNERLILDLNSVSQPDAGRECEETPRI